MPRFSTVPEYLAAQPPAVRAVLKQVRAAIRKAIPKTEELISYQIPAYRVPGGRIVIFFSGWKEHFSLYPASAGVAEAFGKVLGPRLGKKGTIQFPYEGGVPVALIGRIARLRLRETKARLSATRRGSRPSS